MALLDFLRNLNQGKKNKQYNMMLDGFVPVFTSFGENIYTSDIVKNCIRAIAGEISKLQPKHIRTENTGMQLTVNSEINRILTLYPNPLMTMKDFLEKIIWLRELTNNVFIYPEYKLKPDFSKEYTAIYPLNPINAEFQENEWGDIIVQLTFKNGNSYTIKYDNLIHIRKDYSLSELMGGDQNGQPSNRYLLKTLESIHTSTEGINNAIKTSLAVRGILKTNTMLSDEKLEKERQKFIEDIKRSDSAIIAMDLKNEYVPITVDSKFIEPELLKMLESKILYYFGVSWPIISGDFTDEQYQAFYEKTLEPIIIALGQAFSKTLFTDRELQVGNQIIFYPQKLLYTNTKNRIAVADILGNRGALTDNELLELFGYPPFEGGDTRHMSLNFIDRKIASQYQLSKLEGEKK